MDGDEEGDFFVGGGNGYNKRAFIHKGNQWMEVKEMTTARRGKKTNLELSSTCTYRMSSLLEAFTQNLCAALSGQAREEGLRKLWQQVDGPAHV